MLLMNTQRINIAKIKCQNKDVVSRSYFPSIKYYCFQPFVKCH